MRPKGRYFSFLTAKVKSVTKTKLLLIKQ